jgi:hypothetical protein
VVQLSDPATGREFATLEAPEPSEGYSMSFSPDGSELVADLQVWDLRLIRQQLAEIGLDWDQEPYPPPPDHARKPLRVNVVTATPESGELPGEGEPSDAAPPTLLAPAARAVLQNGRLDGSADFVWEFEWSKVPGASHYHLFVIGTKATGPLIDKSFLTSASFHDHSTGCYINGRNLLGWRWKVRAQVKGVWSDWSEERTFDVEPPGK